MTFGLVHATISEKNLETLWKILFPFLSSFPFAITSQHCRGKGECMGVSMIFGEDCSCSLPEWQAVKLTFFAL